MRRKLRVVWFEFLLWRRDRAVAHLGKAWARAAMWRERALLWDAKLDRLDERVIEEVRKNGKEG